MYIYIYVDTRTYAPLHVWRIMHIHNDISIHRWIDPGTPDDPCHPASQGRLLHDFEVAFATHGVAGRHRLPFVAQLTPR